MTNDAPQYPREVVFADTPPPLIYLVWSNQRQMWWKPGHEGYTPHISLAGRYTRTEAIQIVRQAHMGWKRGEPPPEIAVREEDARETGRN